MKKVTPESIEKHSASVAPPASATALLPALTPTTAPTPPARPKPPSAPPAVPPSPTTALLADLQGLGVEAVEATLARVRDAWHQGDQNVIADALIAQASLLETLGTKLLRVAGTEKNHKALDLYAGLALRALEQARKALATLAGLRDKPRVTTAVQVNVAGSASVTGTRSALGASLPQRTTEVLPAPDSDGLGGCDGE